MSQQSFHQQEADGSNITFTITTFTEDEIKVYVDGVESTNGGSNQNDYTIPNYTTSGGTVTWNTSGSLTAPTSPSIVRVVRQTDVMNNGNTDVEGKATFTAGSSIKAGDLNNNQKQVLRALQEHNDHKIQTYDIEDKAVTREKIALDAIDGTRLADDAVDSEHLAADSIDTEHYAPGSVDATAIGTNAVTSAKILNDNVTMEKLGSGALPTDITVNSDNIVNGSIQTADIGNNQITTALIANDQIDSQHYVDGSIDTQHIGDKQVTGGKIADGTITDTQIATGTLDTRYFTETELTSTGVLDSRYYTETELSPSGSVGSNVLDARYFTEDEVDNNFLRQDSSELIASGVTWSSVDDKVATTKAIDLRIIDLVDDVGGFVPIADELSFPNDNPDINDPDSGSTIVSIKAMSTSRTPTAGTVTIANGTLGNSTVTITGCGSTVLPAGFGVLVETTSVGNTYQFHRLVPKATEVSTVAANAVNIAAAGANIQDIHNFADLYQISPSAPTTRADNSNLVVGDLWYDSSSNKVLMIYDGSSGDGFTAATPNASDLANIAIVAGQITFTEDLGNITDALATATGNTTLNTVAGIATEATTVAGIASDVTAVAGNATNINAVAADAADIGAVAGKATEIGLLGTTDAIADMNTLGTSAIVTDMDTLADISSNITTVANNDSNVTAVAGNASNINAVASNASNINAAVSNATNINTVAGNSTNINTVAGIDANVTTVAGNNAAVSTVAGNDANITTVAGSITNVNTTAGSIANVNSVAGSISSVNTTASNISNVNNFAATYQIASSAPSTDGAGNALAAGDLYFDTTANELRVHNGSTFQGGVTATGNLAGTGANTFSGDQTVNANIVVSGTVDGKDISALGITGTTLDNGVTATTQAQSDNSTKVSTTAYVRTAISDLVNSAPSTLDTLGEIATALNNDAALNTTLTNSIATKLPKTGGVMTGDIDFGDNHAIKFGAGNDLVIESDGTNGLIKNHVGGAIIVRANANVQLMTNASSGGADNAITCVNNGAVELYYDNSKKLETTNLGTKIIGDLFLDNPDNTGKDIQFDSSASKMKFDDGVSANFGSGDDLTIEHTGTRSEIVNGTGDLIIQASENNKLMLRAQTGESHLIGYHNAQVELYHNGSKKLETTSSGATITGTCTATTFSGSGASLTSLNASNISSGTISASRIPTLNQNTTGSSGSCTGNAATATNADTVDNLHASSFVRSDASDTMTGTLTIGDGSAQTELHIKKANNAVSDHLQFYNGTTRVGEIGCEDNTFLRINQETNKNIYTPRYIRADSGFFVDGTSKGINGSGNFVGGTISGASDYSTLLRSDTADTANGDITFSGGAGAATISGGSDIRFTSGNWTGEACKIQNHGNSMYIQGGGSTEYHFIFRGSSADKVYMRENGTFYPAANAGADLGKSGNRWNNIFCQRTYFSGSTNYLSYPTGQYGSVQINGSGVNSYEGFSIDGRAVFMHDGSVSTGIYNDVNNHWLFLGTHGGSSYMYYNGSSRVQTTSAGCSITGALTASGNVTAFSDARLKTNVKTIDNALDIVDQLRGVSFDWKESGEHSIGVIAQEVEEVLPEIVVEDEKEVKTVDYGKMVGVLINAIKELRAEIAELKGGK